MVLYSITLIPLTEDIWAADPGLLTPFYSYSSVFNELSRHITQMMKLLLEKETYWGYFLNPSKSLFIVDWPDQEASGR